MRDTLSLPSWPGWWSRKIALTALVPTGLKSNISRLSPGHSQVGVACFMIPTRTEMKNPVFVFSQKIHSASNSSHSDTGVFLCDALRIAILLEIGIFNRGQLRSTGPHSKKQSLGKAHQIYFLNQVDAVVSLRPIDSSPNLSVDSISN